MSQNQTQIRRVLMLLFTCVLVAAPSVPRAEDSTPVPEETKRLAKEHFQRAETAYRQGNFAEALGDYQATLKLRHHPNIIFNIAQCHRQLKNPERALFFYKLFLADFERVYPGTKPPNEDEVFKQVATLEAELREAAARARQQATPVATTGELVLKDVPAGAQVLVDGVLRGQGPLLAAVSVTPGKRLVRVEQPGFEGFSQVILVPASQRVSAQVTLHRLVNVGIDSQPAGAAVIVDGNERGWTPLRVMLPAERAHALELRKEGYHPLAQAMTLEPRETAWASYTLEPTLERFGTRNEWFAFEAELAIGVGGTDGLLGGGVAANIVTMKWKRVSWTVVTLGGGGGSGRFFSHLETRLGYPLRFGSRGQHQLRTGLGFGLLAVAMGETTKARIEQDWLKLKDTDGGGEGDGPFISLCVSPAVEYLYQTRGSTLFGGGLRALVPTTRSLDRGREGSPTLLLFTARIGWASLY